MVWGESFYRKNLGWGLQGCVSFLCLLAILTWPLPGLHPTWTDSEYGEEVGKGERSGFLILVIQWSPVASCVHAKSLQSCPTLWDPVDCCPPGSSVHGILQVRILEWVAISFTRGSSWPRDWTCNSCIEGDSSSLDPPGKPNASTHLLLSL